MKQYEMAALLNIPDRTLRDWKKSRKALYSLLEKLDPSYVEEILRKSNNLHVIKLLENQDYFDEYRAFERELFKYLTSGPNKEVLKKLAFDERLSKEARARSAYLYTFLTKKPLKLEVNLPKKTSLFHKNKNESGDGLASLYGLARGIDMNRYNQYKTKGTN